MRYQFVAYGPALSTDTAQIAFAVSYLGPVPLQYWDSNPTHRHIDSWDAFVALLRARFRPVHAAKQARTELFKIKQSSSQSAGSYASSFQQLLVSLPNMHVEEQVFLFVRGLQPSLKRRIGDRDFVDLSSAINAAVQSEGLYGLQAGDGDAVSSSSTHKAFDAMDVDHGVNAVRLDDRSVESMAAQLEQMSEQLNALRGYSNGSSTNTSSNAKPSSSRDRSSRDGWVPGLSKEQVASRRANGECIRCGSKKHFKRDCPEA